MQRDCGAQSEALVMAERIRNARTGNGSRGQRDTTRGTSSLGNAESEMRRHT